MSSDGNADSQRSSRNRLGWASYNRPEAVARATTMQTSSPPSASASPVAYASGAASRISPSSSPAFGDNCANAFTRMETGDTVNTVTPPDSAPRLMYFICPLTFSTSLDTGRRTTDVAIISVTRSMPAEEMQPYDRAVWGMLMNPVVFAAQDGMLQEAQSLPRTPWWQGGPTMFAYSAMQPRSRAEWRTRQVHSLSQLTVPWLDSDVMLNCFDPQYAMSLCAQPLASGCSVAERHYHLMPSSQLPGVSIRESTYQGDAYRGQVHWLNQSVPQGEDASGFM